MKLQTNKDYEKYKLQWMFDHGYTLHDLIRNLAQVIDQNMNVGAINSYSLMDEAFDIFENEIGFSESEIWPCEDEFEDYKNEYEEVNEW